eukprot:3933193-Rhodomonas_salina.1
MSQAVLQAGSIKMGWRYSSSLEKSSRKPPGGSMRLANWASYVSVSSVSVGDVASTRLQHTLVLVRTHSDG